MELRALAEGVRCRPSSVDVRFRGALDRLYGLRPSSKIGIVGAGAAGLAAAHALGRAGYRDVTVLEASDRVGGKCCTIVHDGRSYELGAGAVTTAYTNVRALMREYDVSWSPGVGGVFTDLDRGETTIVPPPLKEGAPWKVGFEGARFAARMLVERRLLQPGFDRISDDLMLPFAEWARKHRVERVAALIEPWFTGFGYGYFGDVPAAYVLKYFALFRFPVFELLEVGYQGLWERVARDLDVRLNSGVRAVDRSGGAIAVRTDADEHAFDALVLACPLDAALSFLDATAEETELFSAIRWIDYHVIGVTTERAPKARYGFFPKHFTPEHAGDVVFFYRRWLDRDLVLYYTMPRPGTPVADSTAQVRAAVEKLGGRVRAVEIERAWRYFPHVDTATMRAGYYEKLEAMQGRRRTYFAGELLAFTAVEPVVAYSRALVERFFR